MEIVTASCAALEAGGEALAVLRGHEGDARPWDAGGRLVYACAWSADGHLASAGDDRTVRVWNVSGGEPPRGCCAGVGRQNWRGTGPVLRGHEGAVLACAWPADGCLASAGWDVTVRVWDPDIGRIIRIFAQWRQGGQPPGHVVWDPDEGVVLGGSDDAWRYLAWQVREEDGRLTRLPLETFGPVASTKPLA